MLFNIGASGLYTVWWECEWRSSLLMYFAVHTTIAIKIVNLHDVICRHQ